MDVSFLSLSFSLTPRRRTVGAILIAVLIWHFHAGQSWPYLVLFVPFNRILVSRYAPMYFLLRYRLTPVIYISVIIGKVFHPELDENLFPSEVRLPPSFPPFPFSLSFSRSLSLFPFLILAIDFLVRETSVLQTVRHCRINLEADSCRVMPTSLTAVTLSQYDTYSH